MLLSSRFLGRVFSPAALLDGEAGMEEATNELMRREIRSSGEEGRWGRGTYFFGASGLAARATDGLLAIAFALSAV